MADVWKSSCGRVCDVLIKPSMGSSVVSLVAWALALEPAGDRLALVPPPSWELAWALLWPLQPVQCSWTKGWPPEVASKMGWWPWGCGDGSVVATHLFLLLISSSTSAAVAKACLWYRLLRAHWQRALLWRQHKYYVFDSLYSQCCRILYFHTTYFLDL